jgi:hypothetical protein
MTRQTPAPTPEPSGNAHKSSACKGRIDDVKAIIEIAAIVVGGWWAYHQFTVEEPKAHNLVLAAAATPIRTGTEESAILVDVTLRNIGKVKIAAGIQPEGEGCELSVIRYKDLQDHPTDAETPSKPIVDWDLQMGDAKEVIGKYNLLRYYPDYVINPGVEYHERVVVPVTPGYLYGIRARFFADNWSNVDFRYVNVEKE